MQFIHPLLGTKFTNLIKLYFRNGVDLRYWPFATYLGAICLLTMPFRLIEGRIYNKKVRSVKVQPPVFIIGHPRSGTTYLYNILSYDNQFCYPTMRESFPHMAILLNKLKPVNSINDQYSNARQTTKTRAVDNVAIGINEPIQVELSLLNLGALSYLEGNIFPKNEENYRKYLTNENIDTADLKYWQEQLFFLFQKITFIKQKRILCKDPLFTGKVTTLLELFPEAKFIHIYRNPYAVFLSTMKFFKTVYNNARMPLQLLSQTPNFEEQTFFIYSRIMNALFQQQSFIPKENFIEVKYEDLEKNPLVEIEKIYLNLNINGFENAKNNMEQYLETLKGYKKNTFELSPELAEKIYKRLAFSIDKWNYSPPS